MFGQIGCIWTKLVMFGKLVVFRAKLDVFQQNSSTFAKLALFGKMVIFGHNLLYLSKIGCIQEYRL